ncbi:MAG: M48 family metallopeptidase [Pyrinomonadaceae bacterium]
MKKKILNRGIAAGMLVWTLTVLPLAAMGQTRVNMPKNKYKVQDDVKIGREASVEVEKQFPILNDGMAERYVEGVGERLVSSIPSQFQQPAFDYSFKVVNARDINAFALPGGPMYVNRGMIEAAKNEGEMAGVMAHEISHVALRHATAQQTKLNNPLNQILGIGAILGGAILGGQTGAQLGQIFAAGYFLRYSRDYEKQADVLGAQIMADAGYDPRDLANMFRTISEQSGGGRAPEWLSSHPDPGNRYNDINREAGLLRVSSNPIKITQEFSRVQERLRSMPRARSMEEIEKEHKAGQGPAQNPTAGGRYTRNVPRPATRYRTYNSGNAVRVSVPTNWRDFAAQGGVTFAPEGGYGDQGITHGAMLGVFRPRSANLQQGAEDYVQGILQGNSYLRQRSGFSRGTIAGRQAYSTVLSGRSPVSGENEIVTVYITQLRSGDLFYVDTVVPGNEANIYGAAFRRMLGSLQIND